MFYSKTTGGFYTREIHGDNIPADAVEITQEQHAALLQGQSEGKIITADENGCPILVDQPEPTIFERIAEAQAPFIEEQALAKKEYQTADIEGDEEWKAEAQAEYQASIAAMKEAAEQARGGE